MAISSIFQRVLFVLATLLTLATVGSSLTAPALASSTATQSSAASGTATGGLFTPSTGRLLNTSNGTGGYTTPMPAGGWRTVSPLGTNGIPASDVSAVQVAIVAVSPSTNGSVQVRPTGTTPAATTSLYYNSAVSGSQTNTTIVALGADGTFQIKTDTSINLLIDVEGYFTSGATAAGGYVSLSPSERIVNTANGTGAPQATLTTGSTLTVDVAGLSEVPADASAVFVNFEVINRSAQAGHLQPYATGTPRVGAGLSFPASVTTSISGTIPLGSGADAGKLNVYVAGGPIDLLVNVVGYYTESSAPQDGGFSSSFTPGTARLLSGVSVPGNTTINVPVGGQTGVPTVTDGLTAAAFNLQVVATTGGGHIGMWADDEADPVASVLNYQSGTVRSNFATVAIGAGNGISLFNGGAQAVTVYLDLQGWYQMSPEDAELMAALTAVSSGTYTPAQYDLVTSNPETADLAPSVVFEVEGAEVIAEGEGSIPTPAPGSTNPDGTAITDGNGNVNCGTGQKWVAFGNSVRAKSTFGKTLYRFHHEMVYCQMKNNSRITRIVSRRTWFTGMTFVGEAKNMTANTSANYGNRAVSHVQQRVQLCVVKYGCYANLYPDITLTVTPTSQKSTVRAQ